MTTLPTLTPCTVSDCRAPITHWHDDFGNVFACLFALRGEPCPHLDTYGASRCCAPRETATLHLPDVDAVARAIFESEYAGTRAKWDDQTDLVKPAYRRNAQAVLDLIAAHQPVWVEVPKGTLIKAGTRYRRGAPDGSTYESIAKCDFLSGDGTTFIDPRTIPAPTLTERIRAACNDSPESTITLDGADVEALLDMVGGEDK